MKKSYRIEQSIYLISGILCIAFGMFDGITTKVITSNEDILKSVKDTAIDGWMHAGAVAIGDLFIFLWYITREDMKEKMKENQDCRGV